VLRTNGKLALRVAGVATVEAPPGYADWLEQLGIIVVPAIGSTGISGRRTGEPQYERRNWLEGEGQTFDYPTRANESPGDGYWMTFWVPTVYRLFPDISGPTQSLRDYFEAFG
jgi:hypothetical protein